jgi:hypothetical protein
MMRTISGVLLCAIALAGASCTRAGQDQVGTVESALDNPPPDGYAPPPPLPDGGFAECASGDEYTSYYCCMVIIGDAAYCAAMNPPPSDADGPYDLGEGAPAQGGDSFPVPDSGPPPTYMPDAGLD